MQAATMAGLVINGDSAKVRQRKGGRDPSPSYAIPVVTTPSSKEKKYGRKKKSSRRKPNNLSGKIALTLRKVGSPFFIGLVVVVLGTVLACLVASWIFRHFIYSKNGCNESYINGIDENIYDWCYTNKVSENDTVLSKFSRSLSQSGRGVKRIFSDDPRKAPKTIRDMLSLIDGHERLSGGPISKNDHSCFVDLARYGTIGSDQKSYRSPAIGPCHYDFPLAAEPRDGGYDEKIDYYHFRDSELSNYKDKLKCFNECVDKVLIGGNKKPKHGGHFKDKQIKEDLSVKYHQDQPGMEVSLHQISASDKRPVDNIMLIEAANAGLTLVAEKLFIQYDLDPLFRQVHGDPSNRRSLNAIQEALRGGYAELVGILTSGDNSMVIDEYGRTVEDYVKMHGSPIRPVDAKNVLGIDVDGGSHKLPREEHPKEKKPSGWSETSTDPYDKERCDFDVVDGDLPAETFYKEYFLPGRPVVLRGQASQKELDLFSKKRWRTLEHFHPEIEFQVGPTAYPPITHQQYCMEQMSINDLEAGELCEEMPEKPMVHAFHPEDYEFEELFPDFDGNIMHERSGFRAIQQYFKEVEEIDDVVWQMFFGGDGSGATYHWHEAAFNILYVGVKEWKIAPPMYRGVAGMTAQKVSEVLDDKISLTCVQQPGDLFYIPNYWGHSTINHGFTIGAAGIVRDIFQSGGTTFRGEKIHDKDEDEEDESEDEDEEEDEDEDEYPPFLFVHINKTGGTSLISMFSERCEDEYWGGEWLGDDGDYHRSFHATAHAYIEHYGRQAWDQAYTFSVVRHPLARQVSNFFFLAEKGCDSQNNKCQERLIPDLDLPSMSDEQKIEAFHQWIQKLYAKFPPGHPEHYRFGAAGHGNEIYDTFGASQTSWMVDSDGEMVVKDIYKLEEISNDISKMAEKIPCLKNGPLDMAKKNKTSKYPDYTLFAKDATTKKIINEVFADDFKLLGYDPL